MISCPNPGVQMYQLAPATNVFLCRECIEDLAQEWVDTGTTPMISSPQTLEEAEDDPDN